MLARILNALSKPVVLVPARTMSTRATRPLTMGLFYPSPKVQGEETLVKGAGSYVVSSECVEDSARHYQRAPEKNIVLTASVTLKAPGGNVISSVCVEDSLAPRRYENSLVQSEEVRSARRR